MNVREWLSDRWHWRGDPLRETGVDMAAIRELAREASRYDDLSAVQDPHLYAHLDAEPFPSSQQWDSESTRGRDRDAGRDGRGTPQPWRHQWSVIEGGDLTPWMSPEEGAVAARPADPRGVDLGRPFPFIPTHEHVHDVLAEDGTWRTEHDEFMVVDGRAYTREAWENGEQHQFTFDGPGDWSGPTGRLAFGPDDGPVSLPWCYVPWQDGAGDWHTLAVEGHAHELPHTDGRSLAELALDRWLPRWRELDASEERVRRVYGHGSAGHDPIDLEEAVHVARGEFDDGYCSPEVVEMLRAEPTVDDPDHLTPADPEHAPTQPPSTEDRRHPDFLACQEEDRLDAAEARREAEWAARQTAAQRLDRLHGAERSTGEAAALDDSGDTQTVRHDRPGWLLDADDQTPQDMDPMHPDPEHDLELGLE